MNIASEIRKDPENGARILQSEYKAGLTTLARQLCADESDAGVRSYPATGLCADQLALP